METEVPQPTLTDQDEEEIRLLLAREPRNGVGPLTTYLSIAHGIALATCFTTVGNGWTNAQIVTIVERLIPALLLSIIFAGIPLLASQRAADSITRLQHSLNGSTTLINEAIKKSKTLFKFGEIGSIFSVIVFIMCVGYAWFEIETKNFSSRSKPRILARYSLR